MKRIIFQMAFLLILGSLALSGCELDLDGGDPDSITCNITFIVKDLDGNLVSGANISANGKSNDFDSGTPDQRKSINLTSDANGKAEWNNVHFTIYPFGWVSFSGFAMKQIDGVWYDKGTSFSFNRGDGPVANKTVIFILD